MAKRKTKKRRAASPRLQAPQPRRAERRGDWLFWLAAAAPFVIAGVVGFIFLAQRDEGGTGTAPAASTLPATPDYHSLLVSPTDPDHLWLGTHAGLHESTDGGRSWRDAALGGQDAMNLARATGTSRTVWVAGHLVLAKSNDGGASWSDQQPDGLPSLDVHGFATDPRSPKRLWAAVAGEGLYRSQDGGRSFSLVSKQVGPGVMALAVSPSGRILAGDMDQGLMTSTDEGQSWNQVLAEGVMGLAINPRRRSHVLATGQAGVWASRDGGLTWRVVQPISGGGGPVAWASSSPNTAYAVGFDRFLYETTDAAASWRPVS